MTGNNLKYKKIILILTVLLGWIGLAALLIFAVLRGTDEGISLITSLGRHYSYFTIWINTLIAIALTFHWLKPDSKINKLFIKPPINMALALYILIVAIIFSLLLRHTSRAEGLELIADRLLHDVVPILYIILWLFFLRGPGLKWYHLLWWLGLPLYYLFYILVRGYFINAYPYYFLRVSELGYAQVFKNAGGILLAFLLISLLLYAVNNMAEYFLQKSKR